MKLLQEDDSGLDNGSNMPENKRALHNAMERKRRDSIKVNYRYRLSLQIKRGSGTI
jgi:hypothetical protein